MSTRIHKKENERGRKSGLTEQYHQIGIKAVAAAVRAKSARQSDSASRSSQDAKRPQKAKQ
jgi:hypothetical protein